MSTKKKSLKIATVRRAAGQIGQGGVRLPGNLLLNGLWFSSREFRNCLIGAGLDAQIPPLAMKGATVTYDEITVTPEDLVASPEGVVVNVNGREITFKKPGVNNVNMDIDFSSVNVTDNLLNLAKLSTMYASQAPRALQPALPAAGRSTTNDEKIDDIPHEEVPNPGNESIHETEPEFIPNPDGSLEADGVTPVMIPNPAFVAVGP